jgi:hypothetical protein
MIDLMIPAAAGCIYLLSRKCRIMLEYGVSSEYKMNNQYEIFLKDIDRTILRISCRSKFTDEIESVNFWANG